MDKLKKARTLNPSATTLQQLVLAEKAAGKQKDKNGASIALLWFKRCIYLSNCAMISNLIYFPCILNRAMQFIFTLLQKVAGGLDANKAAKEAYAETLSHYHGFMVKKTFEMGLMAAPSSETMLPCLGSDKV